MLRREEHVTIGSAGAAGFASTRVGGVGSLSPQLRVDGDCGRLPLCQPVELARVWFRAIAFLGVNLCKTVVYSQLCTRVHSILSRVVSFCRRLQFLPRWFRMVAVVHSRCQNRFHMRCRPPLTRAACLSARRLFFFKQTLSNNWKCSEM